MLSVISCIAVITDVNGATGTIVAVPVASISLATVRTFEAITKLPERRTLKEIVQPALDKSDH